MFALQYYPTILTPTPQLTPAPPTHSNPPTSALLRSAQTTLMHTAAYQGGAAEGNEGNIQSCVAKTGHLFIWTPRPHTGPPPHRRSFAQPFLKLYSEGEIVFYLKWRWKKSEEV